MLALGENARSRLGRRQTGTRLPAQTFICTNATEMVVLPWDATRIGSDSGIALGIGGFGGSARRGVV